MSRRFARALLPIALAACTAATPARAPKPPLAPAARLVEPVDPPPPKPAGPLLVRGATILTAAGQRFAPGHLLVVDGRLAAVGAGEPPADSLPPGTTVLDAAGRFVTPGLIDTHSHLGVFPYPAADAHADGNEMTSPTTPEVWSEHGIWPQDPGIPRALAGGVTTAQILPGSANLVGGRSVTVRLVPATSARAMRFRGAPAGLKLACGENPKRVYGQRRAFPMTRMGNVAGHRRAFQQATEHRRKWLKYQRDLTAWEQEAKPDVDPPEPPERNLGLETLAQVLDGTVLVHWHCYRADELAVMLDLAKEFGFRIRSFHHALEAYKLRDRLAAEGVSVSTWSDWWGFKLEALDGVPQNAALLAEAGVRAIIHSDSPDELRHLNQEAAKAQAAGRKVGVESSDDETLRWITANPAWALGIDGEVGTLEPGKRADLVIWSAHPFSVYSLPTHVMVDGAVVYERAKGRRASDFELGYVGEARP